MGRVVLTCRMLMGPAILAAALSGCTMKQTEAPPLQGPSELSLAFNLSAIPDVLSQDGASQSQIVVQARDANGQPARSVTFRADIVVGSTLTDFGALSARTLVTDSNGRATLTYTAPASTTGVDSGQQVAIRITPLGTDFANSLSRAVSIRLIPPGVLLPGGPTPSFTVSPAAPPAFTDVLFDASASVAAPSTLIVSYAWDFGDGSTGSGIQAFHRFAAGSYIVTLTLTDNNNVSASVRTSVAVAQSNPTSSFVFAPDLPVINQSIFFDGSLSQATAGRTIVRYDWNFGSGTPQSGITVTKAYDQPGTYPVTLTVTDDVGQKGTSTQEVLVVNESAAGVTARFTMSPSPGGVGQTINFDATKSTTTFPGTIIRYEWNFGDGSPVISTSGTATHSYSTANTSPGYTVTLTVFDSLGRSAATSQILRVQ